MATNNADWMPIDSPRSRVTQVNNTSAVFAPVTEGLVLPDEMFQGWMPQSRVSHRRRIEHRKGRNRSSVVSPIAPVDTSFPAERSAAWLQDTANRPQRRKRHSRGGVAEPVRDLSDSRADLLDWLVVEKFNQLKKKTYHHEQETFPVPLVPDIGKYQFDNIRSSRKRPRTNQRHSAICEPVYFGGGASYDWLDSVRERKANAPRVRKHNRSATEAWLDWLPYGWTQYVTQPRNEAKRSNQRHDITTQPPDVLVIGWGVVYGDGVPRLRVGHNRSAVFMLMPPMSQTTPGGDTLPGGGGDDTDVDPIDFLDVHIDVELVLVDDTETDFVLVREVQNTDDQYWKVVRGSIHTANFDMSPAEETTGWTLVCTIRGLDGTSILAPTVTAINESTGEYRVTLTRTQTSAIKEGVYKWDIWRTNSGGERQLARGTFEILPQVRTVTW